MRYKCAYGPGEVLDPEYYDWHPFDDTFRARLDEKPYISLTQERKIAAGEIPDPNATKKVVIDGVQDTSGTEVAATSENNESELLESSEEDEDTPSKRTVFTTKMSGVMTLKQIEPRLGTLNIMVNNQLAAAAVRIPFFGPPTITGF